MRRWTCPVITALERFLVAWVLVAPMPVGAQQLLSNRSFEAPVTSAAGNNLYANIPDWTVSSITPPQSLPFNIVRPHLLYLGGPISTPAGGGNQYLDISGASGTISQTVTVPSAGMVDISGWFSVRGALQSLPGLTISIRNSSNAVVATASTSFGLLDPLGQWKQASASNIALAAGTYSFEAQIPDNANFDLASIVFKPGLAVSKTSSVHADGISLANPKMISGAVAEYSISATSPSSYAVTGNSLNIVDVTPANTALVVSNIAGAGSGPAAFVPGSSGLTYSFASLGSPTDDVEFSSDNGVSWNYTPVVGVDGTDPAVTTIRLRPKGAMSASSSWTFTLRYRVN